MISTIFMKLFKCLVASLQRRLLQLRNSGLILELTNNWTAYGGIQRYVQWKVGRQPSAAETPIAVSVSGRAANVVAMTVR